MINLSKRSYQKELLDADNIPFEDIKQTMKELNSINTLLGGHKITTEGVKELMDGNTSLTVCEIGCGGGDNLKAISKYLAKKKTAGKYIGIDLKKECTDFAHQQYPELNAAWITSDYSKVTFDAKPDIIFSSLFCHHFTDEQMVGMLVWLNKNTAKGFFINDLERNPVAYYLIKWLTAAFSKSYLVKNDACISVSRGFKKKEWQLLLEKAGIKNYSIRWRWAFRYLVICKK
jgi:2-polyprenyl-3-methyl-5-hydroxy-6-metoxy-1,4-benzoquinol methylase